MIILHVHFWTSSFAPEFFMVILNFTFSCPKKCVARCHCIQLTWDLPWMSFFSMYLYNDALWGTSMVCIEM